jgi:NADPH2:quinone reductase
MRAMRVARLDGPDGLELANMPRPNDPRDVIVEVHAAGVAFADLLMTRGRYQVQPEPPFVPGSDIAGVVVSAPADSHLQPGDRVAGIAKTGAWTGYAAAASTIFKIPDSMAFDAATAMTANYQTSYFALIMRGQLRAGETVLVHGAAGGVGSAAVQIAHAAGAIVSDARSISVLLIAEVSATRSLCDPRRSRSTGDATQALTPCRASTADAARCRSSACAADIPPSAR